MPPRRLIAVPLWAGLLWILLTIGPVFAQDVTPEATVPVLANPVVETTPEATLEALPVIPETTLEATLEALPVSTEATPETTV